MNTRSIIIGIIFVVIVAALGLTVAKRLPKISFLDSLRSRFSTVKTAPTPTSVPSEMLDSITNAPGSPALTACATELNQKDCSTLPKETVCGFQKAVSASGQVAESKLEYLNACYFCKLFGVDGALNMGENTIYVVGYRVGSCN